MQQASSAAHHCVNHSGRLHLLTSYRLRSAPNWLSSRAAGRFSIKNVSMAASLFFCGMNFLLFFFLQEKIICLSPTPIFLMKKAHAQNFYFTKKKKKPSQQIKIPIGNKKKNERTYVFDFSLLHPSHFLQKASKQCSVSARDERICSEIFPGDQ